MSESNGQHEVGPPPKIFLAVPHHDGRMAVLTCAGILTASQRWHPLINFECASLLAFNFNRLWVQALHDRERLGITHFAMLHADIGPDPFWLDMLYDELTRLKADVVSAVSPLKDDRGLTSTGVMDKGTWHIRRLTMFEVLNLPETFNAADAGEGDKALMVNSGCWICDFRKPWVDAFPGFQILDCIARDDESKLPFAQVLSEDWHASRWWYEQGCKVYATRKVKLAHMGMVPFRNDVLWGRCKTDAGEEGQGQVKEVDGIGTRKDESGRVIGWMTDQEADALAELAAGKDVLEIGSYCGLSTGIMAKTARHVHAVDTFDGRGTPHVRNTLLEFIENMKAQGFWQDGNAGKVTASRGEAVNVVPTIECDFDMAFIDGAHDFPSVAADAKVAMTKLRLGGLLVFHDYSALQPGVIKAVDDLIAAGHSVSSRNGSLIALKPPPSSRPDTQSCVSAGSANMVNFQNVIEPARVMSEEEQLVVTVN